MKSVIVQGASVAKAIDEALAKAGMPQEFFVKILEDAQPGFLGFGSKKAKIALFFKKELHKRDGSLVSRGTYKNLFNNQSIKSQIEQYESQEHDDVQPQQVKKEPAHVSVKKQHQQQVAAPAKQPAPVKTEIKPSENQPKIVKPKQAQPEKVVVQKVLTMRPLQITTPKVEQILPVAAPVKQDEASSGQLGQVDASKIDAQAPAVGRKPRRRRRYGYGRPRSGQWGKDTDESKNSVVEKSDDFEQ